MKKEKQGFWVDCRRPTAIASILAFAFSIPMLIMGYADRLHEPLIASTVVLLPVLGAALMIAVIIFYGRTKLWLTVFPVFLGVIGFFFKLSLKSRTCQSFRQIVRLSLHKVFRGDGDEYG